jgi:hypothetical protein
MQVRPELPRPVQATHAVTATCSNESATDVIAGYLTHLLVANCT